MLYCGLQTYWPFPFLPNVGIFCPLVMILSWAKITANPQLFLTNLEMLSAQFTGVGVNPDMVFLLSLCGTAGNGYIP